MPWFAPAFTAFLPLSFAATFQTSLQFPISASYHAASSSVGTAGPRDTALGAATSSVLAWGVWWGWDVRPRGLSCSSGHCCAGRVAFSLQGDQSSLSGSSCSLGRNHKVAKTYEAESPRALGHQLDINSSINSTLKMSVCCGSVLPHQFWC